MRTKEKKQDSFINYSKLFWLFLVGSIVGVGMEGTFCLLTKGHWESHVVSVFGTFNILYGFGAVLYYVGAVKLRNRHIAVRVILMTVTATALELVSGLLLRYGLGMRAWNYENNFMNYKGLICLSFSSVWAIVAYIMCKSYPYINNTLDKFQGKYWKIASVVLGAIMIVDISLTGISIARWSGRHYGVVAHSKFFQEIDMDAPDDWMQSRFMEWSFLE